MCTCPECGCCCDYGRECCPDCHSGNADHLGERGGCKRIDPRNIPAELRIGPCRIGGRFFCATSLNDWWCPAGEAPDFHSGGQVPGV